MTINDEFAKERGYESAQEYETAFEEWFENTDIKIEPNVKMTPASVDKFKELISKNYIQPDGTKGFVNYVVGAG